MTDGGALLLKMGAVLLYGWRRDSCNVKGQTSKVEGFKRKKIPFVFIKRKIKNFFFLLKLLTFDL